MNKLSIGKLARILTKRWDSLIESDYFKDYYNDRAYLGYLILKTKDDSKWQGKNLVFDIRSLKYNPKRYTLRVQVLNWNIGGVCSIEFNTDTIKSYRYTKIQPNGDEFLF